MRNRIINLCLAAIMLLSCFGSAYAAGDAESLNADFEKKHEILMGLSVINPDKDGEYVKGDYSEHKMFRNVSKSEFINYLCNMSGDYGYTSAQSDEAVSTAEGMGVINPGQTDLNKPLCFEEAATMLVRLMDYRLAAEQAGGFPTGYTTLAQKLGLLKGVSASGDESLNYLDMVNLLYNALNCTCAQIDYFSDKEGVVYKNETDITFLYQFRKIYRVDGIIEATHGAELRPDTAMSKGKIMINGYIYGANADYSQYLGMKSECYIKEDDSGEDIVIMAFPFNNTVLELEAEDIDGPSNDYRSLTYYSGNKTKTVSIPLTAAVIYNGVPMTSKSKDKYKPEAGGIKFIDNNQDGSYEVVLITDYKTFVVDAVSLQNEKVTNKFTFDADAKEVVLGNTNNPDDIVEIVLNGKQITVNDLTDGDVLLVAEGKGTKRRVVKALASNDKITGSVSKTKGGDYTTVTVNGIDYHVSKAFDNAVAKKDSKAKQINAGTAYVFSLDAQGRIAFAEEGEGSENYGIVFAKGTKGKMDKTGMIKLFNLNGDLETFEVAEKINFVNPTGTSGMQKWEVIKDDIKSANDSVGSVNLIKYGINSNGEINKIELAESYNDGNNGNFNVLSGSSDSFRTENQSFESKLFIENGAKLFMVSTDDLTKESSYSKTTAGSLNGGTNYPYQAYNVDEYNFAKIIILVPSGDKSKEIRTNTSPLIVASKGRGMDAKGEIKGSIEGMQGNFDSITYTCEDDVLNAVSEGDLIFVTLDSNGTVYDKTTKYSLSMGTGGFTNYTHIHSDKQGVFGGTVKKLNVSDGKMTVDISAACDGSEVRNLRMEASKLSVALFNKNSKTVERGSLGDIEVGDFVVIGTSQSNVNTVVIYR